MTHHRIVLLSSEKYALEYMITIFGVRIWGWGFVCLEHPNYGNVVHTFGTIQAARNYISDPMKVVKVVEYLGAK